MYKIVIFDIDGTLLDTRESMLEAYKYTIAQFGLQETDPRSLFQYVGISTSKIFIDRHGLEGEEFERARDMYYGRFFDEGMNYVRLYDGMKELLDELTGAGVRLAVATARMEDMCRDMLERTGVYQYFEYLGTTPSGKAQGDKDKLLAQCLVDMDAKAEDCVMIGDRKFDINGASKVGMDSIAVTFGFGTVEEMQNDCSPTYIASSTSEIRGILLGDK